LLYFNIVFHFPERKEHTEGFINLVAYAKLLFVGELHDSDHHLVGTICCTTKFFFTPEVQFRADNVRIVAL
jgi:hypothetical protein